MNQTLKTYVSKRGTHAIWKVLRGGVPVDQGRTLKYDHARIAARERLRELRKEAA